MITLSCVTCGKAFQVKPYRVRAGKARFCSRRCLGLAMLPAINEPRVRALRGRKAHNNGGIQSLCEQCGKLFSHPPSRLGIRHFCSQLCYTAAQRVGNLSRYRRITVNGKRVLEHRWMMEQYLGRVLETWEHVDHINRNKRDNRIENFRLLDIRTHGSISAAQRGVPVQLNLHGALQDVIYLLPS